MPATCFDVYQLMRDEQGRLAYYFAGQFVVDGHNARLWQCVEEFQRVRDALVETHGAGWAECDILDPRDIL